MLFLVKKLSKKLLLSFLTFKVHKDHKGRQASLVLLDHREFKDLLALRDRKV
jgi:hypothetical protein